MPDLPPWKLARCKWCAEGVGFPFSSGMRLHGSADFTVAGLCTAPTEAEYIVELQEENERLLQANRYACDVTNQALADRDDARAVADEAVNRSLKAWQSSPAYETFVTLKHGAVGHILRMLQGGQISRGRAAETLAELAHGISPDRVRMPEPVSPLFDEDETPAETCQRLKERLAELEAVAESNDRHVHG